MNIGGLNLEYSNTEMESNKLNKVMDNDYSNSSDKELMDVCKEFEAYFTEQMFKEMAKTVPKSEDTSQATTTLTDYLRDEQIKQISADTTESQGMGLAQMLFEQMKRNEGISE